MSGSTVSLFGTVVYVGILISVGIYASQNILKTFKKNLKEKKGRPDIFISLP
ncbi:MAG: hypothetical protein KAT01_10595 [Candidatus Aminicenantes bacterium]|nr:hypothetical protein [Candidatus Aminicenantes bacterium]